MLGLGIDIGTTSISFVVLDSRNGIVVDKFTLDNTFKPISENVWEKLQDPNIIANHVIERVSETINKYPEIGCIGVTGQMHGILYTDKNGDAVSQLFTWQDERGNLEYLNGYSYAEWIREKTGYSVATGYGLCTHFYNICNNIVDKRAVSLCTIGDYIVMKLVGRKTPILHTSNAASLGLFSVDKQSFDLPAIEKLGIYTSMIPEVSSDICSWGNDCNGINISIAIGDNQASFIGSVNDIGKCILVNVGTGGQISVSSNNSLTSSVIEMRPLIKSTNLLVGSSLCGGRAFELLNNFFKQIADMFMDTEKINIYEKMKECIESGDIEDELSFSTKFCGSRANVKQRASITNLGLNNFTPKHFIVGVLKGIVTELFEMYFIMDNENNLQKQFLIGSGNALRKNKFLQKAFEQQFNMSLKIPENDEEAAYGAALVAFVNLGIFNSIEESQQIIRYI